MSYYIGLDVSLKEVSACVVDEKGKIIKESKVLSEVGDIVNFVNKLGLDVKLIGFEAGQLAPALYNGLVSCGLPAVCLEARHMHAALKAQQVKTDRNDARGIAQMLRMGWYKVVHVKSRENQELRLLLRNRECLSKKQKDIENEIRGTLKAFGIKLGKVTSYNFSTKTRECLKREPRLNEYIEPLLKVKEEIKKQYDILHKHVLKYVKEDQTCRRFMTVPGIGVVNALAFKCTLDDPKRFKRSRNVGVHLGLTPKKYASGEIDYNGHITKCGDLMLRNYLYEAAQVLLTRVTRWSALKSWGVRLAKRGSFKKACIAVARRLAIILHSMWVNGTEFHWGKEEAKQAI
jgi:transposase